MRGWLRSTVKKQREREREAGKAAAKQEMQQQQRSSSGTSQQVLDCKQPSTAHHKENGGNDELHNTFHPKDGQDLYPVDREQ